MRRNRRERHWDGSENPVMPPPPDDTGRRFLLTKYEHQWVADTLYVEVVTDVPCHLFLRWTDKPLRLHNRSTTLGGYYFMTDPKYCFVEWRQVEQDEPGDTLVHTFSFAEWAECQTRWWGFVGTVGSTASPSATSVFTAHYLDYKTTDKLTVYFTLPIVQSTDDCYVWLAHDIYLTALDLIYGHVPGHNWSAGFRFQNVPLGKDDVPVRALLAYRASETVGDTWMRLHGQKDPDPATFSTMADFLARPRTAEVGRMPWPAIVSGNWYNVDVIEIVKEIIALPGWQAHGSMVMFFDYDTFGPRRHKAYSWEADSHLSSPFLWLQV